MAREPKELTEEELNLRRKARRRLIGATALTLAVVVFLPMVLESQPKPSGQDIELRIPAPDKAGEFVPGVIVSEPIAASPQSDAASAPVASEVLATAPVIQNIVPEKIAAEKIAPQPVEPAREPAAPKTPEKPADKAAEKSQGKNADKPAEKATTGYVVQIGAYSSTSTAKQELAKLKKWGFSKAYTEQVGDKTRVRVGPYADRAQADKVRQMLEKHGLHPVVAGLK